MRFRILDNVEAVSKAIALACKVEVESRNRVFSYDESFKENCDKAAQWLTEENGKTGLLIYGSCGNGKTTLMKAIRELIVILSNYAQRGVKTYECSSEIQSRFTHAKDIVISAIEADKEDKATKTQSPYQTFKTIPILLIDDLGVESAEVQHYGNLLNPIEDVLNARYEHQLMTIISTNMPPKAQKDANGNIIAEGIRERYGDRLADRFLEMMQPLYFKETKTYRINK